MSNEIDAMSPEMPPEMTTQEAMSLTGFEQINGILEGRFAPPSIGTLMKYKNVTLCNNKKGEIKLAFFISNNLLKVYYFI